MQAGQEKIKTPLHLRLTNQQWIKETIGLTGAEIRVLYYIKTLDPFGDRLQEASVTQIAIDLNYPKGAVSKALKTLYQKGRIDREPPTQDSPEKRVRDRLRQELGGLGEVVTPAGRIDLLTDNEIIEVKYVNDWKSASSTAVTICGELGITLTFEEVE